MVQQYLHHILLDKMATKILSHIIKEVKIELSKRNVQLSEYNILLETQPCILHHSGGTDEVVKIIKVNISIGNLTQPAHTDLPIIIGALFWCKDSQSNFPR